MEILAQTTHWGLFVFMIVLFSAVALYIGLAIVGIILEIVSGGFSKDNAIALIICASFMLYGIFGIVSFIYAGPDVTYKAKVTDFNAVYHNGYKIVDHDGKLYILRKVGE